MRRPAAVAAIVAAVAVAAYATTAYAVGASGASGPQFPPGFEVASLPAVAIPASEAVAVQNLIGGSGEETSYGIPPEAYSNARQLLTDSTDTLYALPGNAGMCLAFSSATACGDPASGDEKPLIALFRTDEASGDAVGGGVVASSVTSVTITGTDGSTHTFATPKGVFTVTPQDALAMATAPFRYTVNR